MKNYLCLAALLIDLAACPLPIHAQMAEPPPDSVYASLSSQQLAQLLGPIALYPDPLIAQILPAATFPTQIVLADRYLLSGRDPNLIDQQPWDDSVQALARYPSVLKWMDDNLGWTTELGQAFLSQPQEVMDAIQLLRGSAQSLGNLQSTPQQQVVENDQIIEILPADPQVIYVPVYGDTVYSQSGHSFPLITFGLGFPMGAWIDSDFDWQGHRLVVWNHAHPRPANWWHERPAERTVWMSRQTTVSRPDNHRGTGRSNQGDRGWGEQPVARPAGQALNQQKPNPASPHPSSPRTVPPRNVPAATPPRPAPPPVQHSAPVSRAGSNDAFIGIQNSRDTRTFSSRGQQSMRTVTHAAPVARPTPAANNGGRRDNQGHNPEKTH